MQAKTVLIQTQISEGRAVTAYFLQVIYANDGSEVGRAKLPHTVTIFPDSDLPGMLADNNADITTREGMKWEPISAEEWGRAAGHCAVEHTPEVKAAYETYKADQLATREDEAAAAEQKA